MPEMIAWQCPKCHRWCVIRAYRCRCGYVRTTQVFSSRFVATLLVAVGLLIMLYAGAMLDRPWPEGSGAYMEVQSVQHDNSN